MNEKKIKFRDPVVERVVDKFNFLFIHIIKIRCRL